MNAVDHLKELLTALKENDIEKVEPLLALQKEYPIKDILNAYLKHRMNELKGLHERFQDEFTNETNADQQLRRRISEIKHVLKTLIEFTPKSYVNGTFSNAEEACNDNPLKHCNRRYKQTGADAKNFHREIKVARCRSRKNSRRIQVARRSRQNI